MRQLAGKVAVITGAAGGIGRQLAFELQRKGCPVALVDIDSAGLSRLEQDLRSEAGPAVTSHAVDVSDKEQMKALAQEIAHSHGTVDILINNAGVGFEAAFSQTSLEDWERTIAINLWGVVYGCHFFLPALAKGAGGHIVNLSSLFGIVGMAGQTAYCATKFAVRGFSEALAEELRPTCVGLTLVHPGSVATDIMKTARGDDLELLQRIDRWYQQHAMPPQKVARGIVRAIERGQPRLLLGKEAKLGDWLKRLLPVLGNRWFGDAAIRALGVQDMRQKRMDQWQKTVVEREPLD